MKDIPPEGGHTTWVGHGHKLWITNQFHVDKGAQMAQTKPDITVTGNSWTDLNTAASIGVGVAFDIILKSDTWVYLYEGNTAPTVDSSDGIMLSPMRYPYAATRADTGSLRIWAKCVQESTTAKLNVQEL